MSSPALSGTLSQKQSDYQAALQEMERQLDVYAARAAGLDRPRTYIKTRKKKKKKLIASREVASPWDRAVLLPHDKDTICSLHVSTEIKKIVETFKGFSYMLRSSGLKYTGALSFLKRLEIGCC